MHERDGIYYLSYSHGRWNDATYSVHYATAPGPTGPWTYRGVILTTDGTYKGPGHHSLFRDPRDGGWRHADHRWERQDRPGPLSVHPPLALQNVQSEATWASHPTRQSASS